MKTHKYILVDTSDMTLPGMEANFTKEEAEARNMALRTNGNPLRWILETPSFEE